MTKDKSNLKSIVYLLIFFFQNSLLYPSLSVQNSYCRLFYFYFIFLFFFVYKSKSLDTKKM